MIANLRVEGGTIGLGDVGRVTDDGVEGFGLVVEGGQQVGLEETDAVGYVVLTRIGCGDGEGLR